MITERERFIAVLMAGPLYRADVAVCLMGEDAKPRLQTAAHLMLKQGIPTVVLTGGVSDGETRVDAQRGGGMLLGIGVAPDRIIVEPMAQNTHEQAREVYKLATVNEWTRLLLVASSYHIPRAFLTFLQVLLDAGREREVAMLPVPASQSFWWQTPTGLGETRLELLEIEYDKIDQYRDEEGHVASYTDGLAYLEYWERKLQQEA